MKDFFGSNILERLAKQQLLLPYLEAKMLSDEWPDSYQVVVDSSPYQGYADGWFHPSSHPLANEKLLYYTLHPDYKYELRKETRSMQGMMTLAMGSSLHAVVQTKFLVAELITEDDIEVSLVNEEHRGRGSMDWRISHPNGKRYGCEMKTMNSYSFNALTQPREDHVAQLNCYLDWAGLEFGIILYVESGWPYKFKEFVIKKDEALLSRIYEKWDYVLECIENNTPPRDCCGLNSDQMKSCPAAHLCWPKEAVQ